MKILAIDFSSPQRSVAVVCSGARRNEPHESSPGDAGVDEVVETGPGPTRGLELAEEALRAAKLEREQIECLAIGLGPGSYTGIRVAIALAQGWQLARGVKLLGISSVDCLAAQAQTEGWSGRVNIVIDAQRAEFYLAAYDLSPGQCREVEPLRLVALDQVREREQAGAILAGPEVTRWFPAGRILFPRASMLGRLALNRTDFTPGENLEPIYLRETRFVKAPPPRLLP